MSDEMKNIKATIGEYTKAPASSYSMAAPVAVYLNQNNLKQYANYYSPTNHNALRFVKSSYENFGNNIFFQIFPVGHVPGPDAKQFEQSLNFSLLQKYVNLGYYYKRYPSLTINPAGNLITSPVYFDALDDFINNGLYGGEDDIKDKQMYGGSSATSSRANWKVVCGNWNKYNTKQSNDFNADTYFQAKTSDSSGYMSIVRGNFGRRKIVNFEKQQKPISYVQGRPCHWLGREYNPQKHKPGNADQAFTSKRIYSLGYYGVDEPLTQALRHVSQSATIAGEDSNRKPFFFAINFSNTKNVNATLDFGNNRIQIAPNQLILSVADGKFANSKGKIVAAASNISMRRCQCSFISDKNVKTPPHMQDKGFMGNKTMAFIVYPCYSGIAIQPGIHFPVSHQSSQQSPVLRAVGSIVQSIVVGKKRRAPTMQSWVQMSKSSPSSGKGVFLEPHSPIWGTSNSSMILNINNGSANFFYMPLYFLSAARFRMYFKGIKGGEYSSNGIPKSSVYKTDLDYTCTKSSAIQYSSEQQVGDNGEDMNAFAYHTYYGSVIYTTDYKCASSSSAITRPSELWVSQPVQAYRIPPYVDSSWSPDQRKSFWNTYSMDGYYFDFTIGLNKSESAPFMRTPIQIHGVLVMQSTNYTRNLLDNENGTFDFHISKTYNKSSNIVGELPITQESSSQSNSWSQYIQNISVNWNQQGGSGSITLDKYGLMGQTTMPGQSIGGISISMEGGNPSVIFSAQPTGTTQNRKRLFTGYVTKVSASDSFTSDTITLALQGPQRKLTDLKLINPPFWDGDKLKTAYYWLSNYAGIDIVYDTQYFSESTSFNTAAKSAKEYQDQNGVIIARTSADFPKFPTSSNIKRPAVYIKTGQDCFGVFKKLAEMCNCRFVLQPDGKAYVMTQTKNAVPEPCDKTSTGGGRGTAGYDLSLIVKEKFILSFSMQPMLNNLHNYIITASFRATDIGAKTGQSTGSIQSGFKTNKKFKKLITQPQIPWAKVKAFKHQGFLTESGAQQQFERDTYMVSNYWLNIKITIPGHQAIFIYDKLTLFGIEYYVTEINQNVDLVSKKWTTELTLATVFTDKSQDNT